MRALGTVLVLAALALSAVTASELRTHAHDEYQAAQTYEAVYYLPPSEWLPVFSLNWDEAAASLLWMRALVYFGEEFVHGGDVSHVYRYADAMLALDPDFAAVYRWVGVAGLYRPVAITPDDVERAVQIMERGAERFPEDGELAWSLGAALVFELAPLHEDDEEAADRARARGLPHLMRAARLGAAPEWMGLANSALMMHLGRNEQAVRHLEETYHHVDDPELRARITERIRGLREQARADALVAIVSELESKRRRDFPYLSADLFILVGERPPVDLERPIREGLPAALASPPPP